MNKKKILCFCLALGAFSAMMAQETLSLSQCLQMAVENNLSLQKSRNEIAKGKYSISENQAKLLPQINAVAQLNDNFTPPVSVLPTASLTMLPKPCSIMLQQACNSRCRFTTRW